MRLPIEDGTWEEGEERDRKRLPEGPGCEMTGSTQDVTPLCGSSNLRNNQTDIMFGGNRFFFFFFKPVKLGPGSGTEIQCVDVGSGAEDLYNYVYARGTGTMVDPT